MRSPIGELHGSRQQTAVVSDRLSQRSVDEGRLELVLAQITQLPADGQEADARLITDGMEAGDVLPRLRTAVPADLGVTLYQGAL